MGTVIVNLMQGLQLSYLDNSENPPESIDVAKAFWGKLFSPEEVQSLIRDFSKSGRSLAFDKPRLLAVCSNPDLTLQAFDRAVSNLRSENVSLRDLYTSLETLQMICETHALLRSRPFALNLYDGYVVASASSRILYDNCQGTLINPYGQFLQEEIYPIIESQASERFVLRGKPDICAFAIARFIRSINSDATIVLREYDNDYFSLFKVGDLLNGNRSFWTCFDAVVSFDGTRAITKHGVCAAEGWVTDDGGKRYKVDERAIVKVRLQPNARCPWNRCAFCGINQKYATQSSDPSESDMQAVIKRFSKAGATRFWAVDEAVPPHSLMKAADIILEGDSVPDWHARSRIDRAFLADGVIERLARAGMKHMILGLESASYRVLKTIEKTEDEHFLDTLEEIVRVCNQHGIAVHCPVIIGFPFETQDDIYKTLDFLKYMIGAYPNFSFNVNKFYLDISSQMFKAWESYGIAQVSLPCRPDEYIGNVVEFKTIPSMRDDKLVALQNETMQALYPWHPKGAHVSPSVFYAILEANKLPLVFSQNDSKWKRPRIDPMLGEAKKLRLAPSVAVYPLENGRSCLYDFRSHHYVEGASLIEVLSELGAEPFTPSQLTSTAPSQLKSQIIEYIAMLLDYGFLEVVERG